MSKGPGRRRRDSRCLQRHRGGHARPERPRRGRRRAQAGYLRERLKRSGSGSSNWTLDHRDTAGKQHSRCCPKEELCNEHIQWTATFTRCGRKLPNLTVRTCFWISKKRKKVWAINCLKSTSAG